MSDEELERFIVSEDSSVIDAIQKINDNNRKIVFICKRRKLLGSVSDGDVRRHILNNRDLNVKAMEIAYKETRFVYEDEVNRADRMFKKTKLSVLPVLNKNEKITDILFFDSMPKLSGLKFSQSVPIVIMAGGKGTRLAPLTEILPKPLVSVNGKPVIEHIIEGFEYFGGNEFFFIVNYKKEFIRAFFADSLHHITFYEEDEYCGTGGGLSLLKGKIDSTFIVSNCDILIDCDYPSILETHKKQGNVITVICAEKEVVIPYGVLDIDNGRLRALTEKPKYDFLVNTGVYICERAFLDSVPDHTFIHITDIIKGLIEQGKKVGIYKVKENEWMDMGTLDELSKMQIRLQGI